MYGWRLGPSGLFTRWHRSLTVSHVGTWRDPHTPPPYWDPLFTNRHVVLSSSMPYDWYIRLHYLLVFAQHAGFLAQPFSTTNGSILEFLTVFSSVTVRYNTFLDKKSKFREHFFQNFEKFFENQLY